MKKLLLSLSLLYSAVSFASTPNIIIDGTVTAEIPTHPEMAQPKSGVKKVLGHLSPTVNKEVTLLHVYLSPQTKAYLAQSVSKQLSLFNEQQKKAFTPSVGMCKVQLGMNVTPVLNQGHHGTCVTFATTAAIDAALKKGDYLSQLCNLELGSYLNTQDDSYPTGWDGSWAGIVTDQIKQYGYITKPSQVFTGCSGYHLYPTYKKDDRGNPMSACEFTERSKQLPASLSFDQMLKMSDAISPRVNNSDLLDNVKNALRAGNRVLVATILDPDAGFAGAQGKFSFNNDSWILTPDIEKHARQGVILSAHEMVITGFDDNAVITGPSGTQHHGVLTIRNSWGYDSGDWGDYYMSYDYFKVFVFDLVTVNNTKK
jgi:hypothetical protein